MSSWQQPGNMGKHGNEAAYESLITLPLFPSMTEQDVEDVVKAVAKVVTYYCR